MSRYIRWCIYVCTRDKESKEDSDLRIPLANKKEGDKKQKQIYVPPFERERVLYGGTL